MEEKCNDDAGADSESSPDSSDSDACSDSDESLAESDWDGDMMSPAETLFIFEWEGALYPSSALRRKSLMSLMENNGFRSASSLVGSIEVLEKCTISLLRTCLTLGHVVVVSCSSKESIDQSAAAFLRRLHKSLSKMGVDVVSAHDLFCKDEEHDVRYTEWMTKAIEQVVTDKFDSADSRLWEAVDEHRFGGRKRGGA